MQETLYKTKAIYLQLLIMAEESSITIKVNIAGKLCPMTIKREEEEIIRKAAQLINNKISKYQERYTAHTDTFDFLAVTALQHTIAMIQAENRNDTEPVLNEIEKISLRLDEIIKGS